MGRKEKRIILDVIPAKAGISLTIKEIVILNEVKNPSSINCEFWILSFEWEEKYCWVRVLNPPKYCQNLDTQDLRIYRMICHY